MRRETKSGHKTIATYGLSEEQHNVAVECVEGNLRGKGGYKVIEVDDDTWNIWHEDAEGEYKDFLQEAIGNDAEKYTLNDYIGDFGQPIGEVIVY